MQGENPPDGGPVAAKKRSNNKFKPEGGPPKRREKLDPPGQAPPPSKKQRRAQPPPPDAAVPPRPQPPMQQPARAEGDGESKRKKKKRRQQQQLEQGHGAAAAAGSLPTGGPQPEAAASRRPPEPQGNSASPFGAKGKGRCSITYAAASGAPEPRCGLRSSTRQLTARPSASPLPLSSAGKAGGGGLLDRMRQRLQGGRFRWLNELLYTTGGEEALSLMTREPDLYEQYHEGTTAAALVVVVVVGWRWLWWRISQPQWFGTGRQWQRRRLYPSTAHAAAEHQPPAALCAGLLARP